MRAKAARPTTTSMLRHHVHAAPKDFTARADKTHVGPAEVCGFPFKQPTYLQQTWTEIPLLHVRIVREEPIQPTLQPSAGSSTPVTDVRWNATNHTQQPSVPSRLAMKMVTAMLREPFSSVAALLHHCRRPHGSVRDPPRQRRSTSQCEICVQEQY
jgi:hypothetical protein